MAPSAERFRILELVHSWYYTPSAFLIPMPEDYANNVEAVVKPFQFWVR
jgi:ionotropic glutamate receptor